MEELLRALWELLKNDSELATMFGGEVLVRYMRRQREDPFPVILYSYTCDPNQPWPMQAGAILLVVIDASDNADLCFQIMKRIRHLLERQFQGDILEAALNPDKVKACRLWLGRDTPGDTDSDLHWRRNQTIQFRFYDQELALAVLQR